MKIISFSAENFMRLVAVRINPNGSTVIVGGKNGAGKSAALLAIQAALGGKTCCPEEPVRRGAKKAEIIIEMDDIIVTRTFSKKGTQLEVASAEGKKYGSPQKMLDELVGPLSFDPLEFSRMDPHKQAEVVRRLAALDFTGLEAERRDVFEERTILTRAGKENTAQLNGLSHHEGVPDAVVSVSDLVGELELARCKNKQNERDYALLADYEKDLQSQKDEQARLEDELNTARHDLAKAEKCAEDQARRVADLKEVDTSPLREAIQNAEANNTKVRENIHYDNAIFIRDAQINKHKELTGQLSAIDQKKADAIQNAKYPIDGMTVTDEGVELHGLPFKQASSAEQLACSVAMGLALNPTLKVLLVRDGSLLDEDSLAQVAEIAARADAQVWIERVGKGRECTVIIEDGSVLEADNV